jgi:hypothetical protein
MYWLFGSKDFGGVINIHFVELNMRFLPNAPIHVVCYIRKVFDFLGGINVFFI